MFLPVVYCLIAKVAKVFMALNTVKQVPLGVLLVHVPAPLSRTKCAKLSVDKGTTVKTHILFDKLIVDLFGLEVFNVTLALGILFEMLLAFSRGTASPAKPIEAERTLHVVAARLELLDLGTTLLVRAGFHALLDEQVHESFCSFSVAFLSL
jgi:hypothetical protein